MDNLSAHYERMRVIKPKWEDREYLGIRQMLFETVNQKSKDKSPVPNMAAMVLQAVISGGKYPASLYTDTLIRIRAEQGNVTWGRAGIIQSVFNSKLQMEGRGGIYGIKRRQHG